ncbi:MAG: hypothetical protein KME55_08495 [Nostoc indistinguendum CM1-VF10]|nr:hypothetical protein [Nostoc indistinguendum CM1-VF10]
MGKGKTALAIAVDRLDAALKEIDKGEVGYSTDLVNKALGLLKSLVNLYQFCMKMRQTTSNL